MADLTVRFKRCGCGVLAGEVCDCAAQVADLDRLAANPIYLPGRRNGTGTPQEGSTAMGSPTGKDEFV